MKNRCVIYARFSAEDELRDGKSRSISNQVSILKEYAAENKFIITNIYEDYMYSGKNFDRPQVKELIKAAYNKEFDILLLKDLSRLGRNYIDVGTHLEKTFLGNGIRVISLNDYYDSDKDYDYLTIALKNYLNDFYIKDISKKLIRVTLARSQHEFLGSRHYGYIFKNKEIEIYEPEAIIVRRIFNEYINGSPIVKIIAGLKKDKIVRKQWNYPIKMGYVNKEDLNDEIYEWASEDIRKTLVDDFYIGTATNFKNMDSKNKIDHDPIVFENHHEAIISKKDFDYVNNELIRHNNMVLKGDNLRRMIYCKRCLTRYRYELGKAPISPTIIDGKEVYHDYRCRKSYPLDILNRRILDMLLIKHKYILDHKIQYIENIIGEKYNDANILKEVALNKKKYEAKGATLFESYVNGEIPEEKFSIKMKELNQLIKECDKRLDNASYEEFQFKEVEDKVDNFLKTFNVNEEDKIKLIKDNISKAIYDPVKGTIVIILKLEEDIDVPSLRLKSFIKPETSLRSEYDLDDIIYKIISDTPHLKTKDILERVQNIWEGFTFKGVERSIRSLRLKNMIKKEGKSDLLDGYVKIDYKEEFDYHNMELNRKEKSIYRLLWYNPKLSYTELCDITNTSLDQMRKIIRKIRRMNGFEYSHLLFFKLNDVKFNILFQNK